MSKSGDALRKLRIQHGYTQQEVADVIGVTKSTISKYEKGQRNLSGDHIEKLSELFGADRIYIFTGKTKEEWRELIEMGPSPEEANRRYWEDAMLTEEDAEMLSLFNELNYDGKQAALERVEEMTQLPQYQIKKTKNPSE